MNSFARIIVNLVKEQIWHVSLFFSSIFTSWEFSVPKDQFEWSVRAFTTELSFAVQKCEMLGFQLEWSVRPLYHRYAINVLSFWCWFWVTWIRETNGKSWYLLCGKLPNFMQIIISYFDPNLKELKKNQLLKPGWGGSEITF